MTKNSCPFWYILSLLCYIGHGFLDEQYILFNMQHFLHWFYCWVWKFCFEKQVFKRLALLGAGLSFTQSVCQIFKNHFGLKLNICTALYKRYDTNSQVFNFSVCPSFCLFFGWPYNLSIYISYVCTFRSFFVNISLSLFQFSVYMAINSSFKNGIKSNEKGIKSRFIYSGHVAYWFGFSSGQGKQGYCRYILCVQEVVTHFI